MAGELTKRSENFTSCTFFAPKRPRKQAGQTDRQCKCCHWNWFRVQHLLFQHISDEFLHLSLFLSCKDSSILSHTWAKGEYPLAHVLSQNWQWKQLKQMPHSQALQACQGPTSDWSQQEVQIRSNSRRSSDICFWQQYTLAGAQSSCLQSQLRRTSCPAVPNYKYRSFSVVS